MPFDPVITREIAPLPKRRDDAHKGEVGRILVIGGSTGEMLMLGAPVLAANAALRSGAGLVQIMLPADLRVGAATLAPCATFRTLSDDSQSILDAANEFQADVLIVGPGLGRSLSPNMLIEVVARFSGPVIIDADGLNRLAEVQSHSWPNPQRVVLTPHPGEAQRLLDARGIHIGDLRSAKVRRDCACELAGSYSCTVVLKGQGTIVTDGNRLFLNNTGNSGMATAGTGDVLTGVIAALIGQGMDSLEGAILGVHVHGLAGDFAAQELGRLSLTATDLIEYLPDAFCDHDLSSQETPGE